MKKLILGSASPRRRELLQTAGITFTVESADIDETRAADEGACMYVQRMALNKASAVAKHHEGEDVLVLGADTIVVHQDEIMGKPTSPAEANDMLKRLNNDAHTVMTAVCLIHPASGKTVSRLVSTRVCFADISESRRNAYVATGEPMDKAGAYGIQGGAAGFVRRIEGSYTNVVGLPLSDVLELLFSF